MRRHSLLFLLSLLLLSGGCSTGTDPGPCEEVECRRITDLMVIQRGFYEVGDSILPFFHTSAMFGMKPGGVDVYLPSGSMGGESIRSVSLNGLELRSTPLDPRSSGYYYRFREDLTDSILEAPGDWNEWGVSWTSFDSAVFRVRTPVTRATITTSPAYTNDTLSTDEDLSISWPAGSLRGEERNSLYVLLKGDGNVRVFSYEDSDDFFLTDLSETSIHRDSLRVWSREFRSLHIQLEHYSIRDSMLSESSWARTVFSDRDVRTIHFPRQ